LLEDGKPLKRASSAKLDDGKWFDDQPITSYKPTGGVVGRHLVERCSRGSCLHLQDKHNILIEGLTFYGAAGFGVRLIDCNEVEIKNCIALNNGYCGVSLERRRSDSQCDKITIRNNIIEWNGNGIYISGKESGRGPGYENCEIVDNGIGYTNFEKTWRHKTKDGHAIGIQNSSYLRIERNNLYFNYTGICLWTASNRFSNNNIFARNCIANSHLYGVVQGGDGVDNSGHNVWAYNIIINNGHWPGNWGGLRINRCQSQANYFLNNTLYNNDINIYLYSFPNFHVVKNNLSLTPVNYHVLVDSTAGHMNVLNNNCYYSNLTNEFGFRSSSKLSFEGWKRMTGHDTKSILTDPILVSDAPQNPDDFFLKNESPCIGKYSVIPSVSESQEQSNSLNFFLRG
jgi:parallel beta-helix repeat protein